MRERLKESNSQDSYKEMLPDLRKLVEQQCRDKANIFGYEIWTYHMVIVIQYAKLLAEKLGADTEIVEIAAILHDYASVKGKELFDEHHIHGANEAERILRGYGYPQERIDKVKHCIRSHRGSQSIPRESKEAICVASADAMAHIDQIPSLLHMVYFKKKMAIDEGAKWVKDKIERSWNKLCPEAKEMVRSKYESAKIILG